MSVQSRSTTTATPQQVWALMSDLDAWPSWLPTVDSVQREEPDRPHEVGAAYRLEQPRLPKARWVITQWRPEQGFVWESKAPGVTTTATHELTATADGGTEIRLGIEWTGPLAGLLGLLVGRITRRYVDTEAAALAERAVPG